MLGTAIMQQNIASLMHVVLQYAVGVDVICEKTATLIFLDFKLVHHFIDRKLVIQSLYIFQANPTLTHFILVTGHVL
jgi:hypothetical protein